MYRKLIVTVVAALIAVGTASPAAARPVPDSPVYKGPCVACKFQGVNVSGRVR